MLRNGDVCMELKTTRPGQTHAIDRFASARALRLCPQRAKQIAPPFTNAKHCQAPLSVFFFNTHLLRTPQQPRRRRISPLTRRAATLPSTVRFPRTRSPCPHPQSYLCTDPALPDVAPLAAPRISIPPASRRRSRGKYFERL